MDGVEIVQYDTKRGVVCFGKDKIRAYFAVFLSVFVTDAVSLPVASRFKIIFLSLAGMLLLADTCFLKRRLNDRKFQIWFLMPVLCVLLSQFRNLDFSMSYEYKIALMGIGFFIASQIGYKHFMSVFVNVMFVLAVVSLILFAGVVLGRMFGAEWWKLLPMVPGGDYYTVIFGVVPSYFTVARNYGIFWEPGVFQIYLNFAIWHCLVCSKKTDWKKIVVFGISVLTTLSTTGYICTAAIVFIYLVDKGPKITKHHIWILLMIAAAFLLVAGSETLYSRVFLKFQNGTAGYRSFMIRLKDIQVYFHEWLVSPLTGSGITASYQYAVAEFAREGVFQGFRGSVSTTMREFSGMGGIFGISRVLLQWHYAKVYSKRFLSSILLFLVIMIFLNTEDLIYSAFANTIFYFGILEAGKREKLFQVAAAGPE